MNLKTAKRLRRQAKQILYTWYLSLLEEDQRKELTPDLALHYTPTVQYWFEDHEKYNPRTNQYYVSKQAHVSEGTLRWFILQEKKRYDRRTLFSTTP